VFTWGMALFYQIFGRSQADFAPSEDG
jgi:hypothetical protein